MHHLQLVFSQKFRNFDRTLYWHSKCKISETTYAIRFILVSFFSLSFCVFKSVNNSIWETGYLIIEHVTYLKKHRVLRAEQLLGSNSCWQSFWRWYTQSHETVYALPLLSYAFKRLSHTEASWNRALLQHPIVWTADVRLSSRRTMKVVHPPSA